MHHKVKLGVILFVVLVLVLVQAGSVWAQVPFPPPPPVLKAIFDAFGRQVTSLQMPGDQKGGSCLVTIAVPGTMENHAKAAKFAERFQSVRIISSEWGYVVMEYAFHVTAQDRADQNTPCPPPTVVASWAAAAGLTRQIIDQKTGEGSFGKGYSPPRQGIGWNPNTGLVGLMVLVLVIGAVFVWTHRRWMLRSLSVLGAGD